MQQHSSSESIAGVGLCWHKKSFFLYLHQCDAIDAIAFNGIGLIYGEEMGKEAFCVLVGILKNRC